MTSRPPAQCGSCTHFRSPLGTGRGEPFCAAYPDGIPEDIWWNRVDHRKAQPRDHGIRWEAREGAEFPEFAMNT